MPELRLTTLTAASSVVVSRLAEIFSSDPDFLEASEGRRTFAATDVERFIAAEHAMGAKVHLLQDGEQIVGVTTTLAPHPREPFPWVGLLLVDEPLRRKGYGPRAATLLEAMFRGDWPALRLAVLHMTPLSRRFWTSLKYAPVEERTTQEGRPATVFEKPL